MRFVGGTTCSATTCVSLGTCGAWSLGRIVRIRFGEWDTPEATA